MTEYFKQDEFQLKIDNVRWQIKVRAGEDILNRVVAYGFKKALQDSQELGIVGIKDDLQRGIAFNRLERFRTEYALLEFLGVMDDLRNRGYGHRAVRNYLNKIKVEDLVVFE